jgi:hypothetical protein
MLVFDRAIIQSRNNRHQQANDVRFLKTNVNPRRSHQEHVNKHVTCRYISIPIYTETQSAIKVRKTQFLYWGLSSYTVEAFY